MSCLRIIGAAAALSLLAAPALAEPPQAVANLVDGNSAILVETYGEPSVPVTEVILVTPEGEEIRAGEISRYTETERTTTTTQSGGTVGAPTVGVGVGTGYYSGSRHSGTTTGVGLGIGVPLFGGGGGSQTTTQTVEHTKTEARIAMPQPIHYLQLWQSYRLEVVYQEGGVEKVLNVPTPRPRAGN